MNTRYDKIIETNKYVFALDVSGAHEKGSSSNFAVRLQQIIGLVGPTALTPALPHSPSEVNFARLNSVTCKTASERLRPEFSGRFGFESQFEAVPVSLHPIDCFFKGTRS